MTAETPQKHASKGPGRPAGPRNAWGESWEGGRVWYDADGRRIFVIRRQVNGKRYERSTHTGSHRAALAQLDRFGADPENYDPRGEVKAAPIYLDADLREKFLRWSKEKGKRGYGNTADWVRNQGYHLLFWIEALGRVDLRRATLADHILPALRDPSTHAELPNYKQRVQVLKTLYGWLRTVEHLIGPTEDPTFGTLTVPPARAAQLEKSKVVPVKDLLAVVKWLRKHEAGNGKRTRRWGDLLFLLGGTGWHVTELSRFAECGAIEPVPEGTQDGDTAGVLVVTHKSGKPHRCRVSEGVLKVARKVVGTGSFSRAIFDKKVGDACKEAKVPHFTPGRMRHTVATWAENHGAAPEFVSGFLGHSPQTATTKKHYSTHATPKRVPTPV
jgi:integrase